MATYEDYKNSDFYVEQQNMLEEEREANETEEETEACHEREKLEDWERECRREKRLACQLDDMDGGY